jgi:predicted S18 family serine protease
MVSRRSLYIVFITVVVLSFALFTGCAKPPTEEMTKAEKALEEAKQKEAPTYVPDLFTKAEESLKKAKDYVANKKYKEAKLVAIETETFARQAIAGIGAAKAKMKADAEQLAQDVQKGIDDLKALVAGGEKKKALAAVREEIQGVVTKWETNLTSIKEKLQSKTREATDELRAMKEEVEKKKEEATSLLTAPPAPPAAQAKKKK